MHKAVQQGHLEMVEALSEKRGDPNAQNEQEMTPLHDAYEKGTTTEVEKSHPQPNSFNKFFGRSRSYFH